MSSEENHPQILVAEDEVISRRLLESVLKKSGYDPIVTSNGAAAWSVLRGPGKPAIAILDWMMPEMDGLELCRKIRGTPATEGMYLILLTARGGRGEAVQALQAGADDYVTKPFHADELIARLQVGLRVTQLQAKLAERVRDLEEALVKVKRLQGLLPICSYCKKIRDDGNYWQQVDTYISEHSEALFSHGICPDCLQKLMETATPNASGRGEP